MLLKLDSVSHISLPFLPFPPPLRCLTSFVISGWQFGNAIQQSIPVVGAWRAPAKLTSSDVQTVVSLADLKCKK